MFFTPDPILSRGACVDLSENDKQLFYSIGNGYMKAKAICAECTVRPECLQKALSFEVPGERRYGVWGGLSSRERDRLFGGGVEEAVA